MLFTREDTDALSSLGLTGNQSRVYLAVLNQNGISIGDISKQTKIRREEVYRTIPKLEKMGLVEKLLSKPTMIRALPVQRALSNLIDVEKLNVDKRIAELRDTTARFVNHYNKGKRINRESGEDSSFILLTQPNGIVVKASNMIAAAEKKIDAVYAKKQLNQFIPVFSDPLKQAVKRGVKARLIAQGSINDPDDKQLLTRIMSKYLPSSPNIEVRAAEVAMTHSLVVDRREALSETSLENEYLTRNPSLWTNNKGFVALIALNFESVWAISQKP
jgi:sugar-specific transcriptional regulator TrmB